MFPCIFKKFFPLLMRSTVRSYFFSRRERELLEVAMEQLHCSERQSAVHRRGDPMFECSHAPAFFCVGRLLPYRCTYLLFEYVVHVVQRYKM